MCKNLYHTAVERAQIVALHTNGMSQHQILKQIGVNKSFVQRAIKKFNSEGIYGNRKKSGRLQKTTVRDDNTIKRIIVHSHSNTCKNLSVNLLRKKC